MPQGIDIKIEKTNSDLNFSRVMDKPIKSKSTLVDTLLSILEPEPKLVASQADYEMEMTDSSFDSFIEEQANQIELIAPTTQLSLSIEKNQKKIAVEILKENGFSKYAEEYADFFLSFLGDAVPTLNQWIARLSSKHSIHNMQEARMELIKALRGNAGIVNQIGAISDKAEYVFDENKISNEVARFLLSEILKNENALQALYQDTKTKPEGASRCVSVLPCRITYTDLSVKIVTFVGISGYSMEIGSPLYNFHMIMKPLLNDIKAELQDLGEVEFRYIEDASERYDLLLEQANRAISGREKQALLVSSDLLPSQPMKACAEKKIFSELAKQYMSKAKDEILEISVLGETNIQLPTASDFEHPVRDVPEHLKFSDLNNAGRQRIKEIDRLINLTKGNINSLREGLLTFKQNKSKAGQKKLSKGEKQIEEKEKKIVEYQESRLRTIASETRSIFYLESSIDAAAKTQERVFLPFTQIPACHNCQKQKLPYLAVIMKGAAVDWKQMDKENAQENVAKDEVLASISCASDVSAIIVPAYNACIEQNRIEAQELEISPKRTTLRLPVSEEAISKVSKALVF